MLLCACSTAHPHTRNDKHCGILGRHRGPSRQELWTGPFPGSRMFKVAKYVMSKQIQQNLDFFLKIFQTMAVQGPWADTNAMELKRPGRYFQVLALLLFDLWPKTYDRPTTTIQLIHPALIALKRPRPHKMALEELGRPPMNWDELIKIN